MSYWRKCVRKSLAVLAVFIIPISALAQEGWRGNQWIESGSFEDTPGVARLETWYTPLTNGFTEPGTTNYPAIRPQALTSIQIPDEWAVAGVVRNESNYAYVATANPSVPGGTARLVPVDFNTFMPNVDPSHPIEGGAHYAAAVSDPNRFVAFFARESEMIVDEIFLEIPEDLATPFAVSGSVDFTPLEAEPGGFLSAAGDTARSIFYFGRAKTSEIAMVGVNSNGPENLGIVRILPGDSPVEALAVDPTGGFLFAATSSPETIHVLSLEDGISSPTLLHSFDLRTEMPYRPRSLIVDDARRVLFVGTAGASRRLDVGRFAIAPGGALSFTGSTGSELFGNQLMLHDPVNRWLYRTGFNVTTQLLRFDDGGDGFPVILDPADDIVQFPNLTGNTDVPVGFFSPDYEHGYFLSRGTGAQSRLAVFDLNPSRNLAGAVHAVQLFYTNNITSNTWITSVNLYTHGDGGTVRLAIYGSSQFNNRPQTLLWQSPEVPSVKKGWVSIPITEGTPSILSFTSNRYIFPAFQVSNEEVMPGFVGSFHVNSGARLDHDYGDFPAAFPNTNTSNRHAYAMYFTHQERAFIQSFRLTSTTVPDSFWTNDGTVRAELTNVRGQPDVVQFSTISDFATFQEFPAYGDTFEFTIPPENLFYGAATTIHARVVNEFSNSVTRTATVRYDNLPPFTPDAPVATQSTTDDGIARFHVAFPADRTGGSGVRHLEIQIGSAPGLDDLFTGILETEGLVEEAVQLGVLAYARVRAMDNAGNFSAWSQSSSGIEITAAPVVTITGVAPAQPRTADNVLPLYQVVDPDGDDIVAVAFEWILAGDVATTSATLSSSLTAKDQQWTVRIRATDSRGDTGQWATFPFAIANTPPTQPFVRIVPPTPGPDEDLIVDVQVYSTDADGDEVGYEFRWFKSINSGATFVEKIELRGSPQVNRNFINVGELWEVRLFPFELATSGGPGRVDGAPGRDRVYIGENQLPEFQVAQPIGIEVQTRDETTTIDLAVYWTFREPDGEACTVDIYWTDLAESGLVPIAEGLDAELRRFRGNIEIPNNRPIHIHAIITDEKGAIVQRITPPILIGEIATGVVTY